MILTLKVQLGIIARIMFKMIGAHKMAVMDLTGVKSGVPLKIGSILIPKSQHGHAHNVAVICKVSYLTPISFVMWNILQNGP